MSQAPQGTHPGAPLVPKEAAALIGVSTRTLERWRKAGVGPPYAVHCNRIWYRRRGIDEFLESVFAPAKAHAAPRPAPNTPHPAPR